MRTPKRGLYVQIGVDYVDDPDLHLACVSRLARTLWLDAELLCRKAAIDGVLTVAQVERAAYPERPAAARRQAAELVASGAWSWDEEHGVYRITGWLDRHPSRAEVLAGATGRRAEKAASGTLGNHTRWHVQRGITDPGCEHCRSQNGSQTDRTAIAPASQVRSHPDRTGIADESHPDRKEEEEERTTPVRASGVKLQTARGRAPASAPEHARDTRPSRGRQWAEALNATARKAVTQAIVSAFEQDRGAPLLPDVRRTYVRVIDDLLDAEVARHEIEGALPALAARGAGPAVLPHLIDERRAKLAAGPVHERPVEQLGDDDLTPAVLADLLGPDTATLPPAPDEVEEGPADVRRAWYADQRDLRLAERRAEARALLTRRQAAAAGEVTG
ncbi:MAG TPA: hypothetical protein VGD67_26825 [Pseudonocardiaceae bacterium]